MLGSVLRANKRCYPQTLLEEFEYEIKKNKMEKRVNDDLGLSLSDESDNEFENGSDNESDNNESND